MTSLLKSKFDTSARRAIYLSADKLAVYHWDNGKLGSSYLFDVNTDGQKYFEHYLKESRKVTTYLLVDVIEEEYRQETIPHVIGPDRRAMIERKKSRMFRDTPYFYADIQGREEEGRRDDRVLFVALTNPGILAPWLKLLDDNKVPLAGIYSLPRLTKSFLDTLPEPSDHMLVVSLQSISGLRQTFFHKRELKLSRLVSMPRYGTEPYAPHINEEVEKIRRYLNSLRLTPAEKPLDIYYLANAELLNELKKLQVKTTFIIRHHLIDINLYGQQIGLNRDITTPFSDQLFIYHLLKNKPVNYFASNTEKRYFQMQKSNRAMLAASIAMILIGMLWGGFNFIGGLTYKQQGVNAQKKTEFYNTRYELARERLPQTVVSPADLQVVVGIANTLKEYKLTPLNMLKLIGRGMDRFPSIELDEIVWTASADPNMKFDDIGTGSTNQAALGVSDVNKAEGYQYYQIASIKGHLSSFDGNYREALSIIDQFAQTLRNIPLVHDVSIMSLPLDISSDVSLQGTANAGPGKADFSVRIVLGVSHET